MIERLERIEQILDAKKALDIEIFDMRAKDYMSEYVVIATSLGAKHTLALLDELKNKLKPFGEEFLKIDESEEWVVIDLGDILIHLMIEEYRKYYNIEEFLSSLERRE